VSEQRASAVGQSLKGNLRGEPAAGKTLLGGGEKKKIVVPLSSGVAAGKK